MKNKIIITGGAGFIGTELIKRLKNKTDLIVVDKKKDNRLISKFKKLKIRYIQGDLINENFSKKIYKNAKTIFHLAGIVKVPSTDINLDIKKEKKIFNEAIKIIKNLIKFTNNKTLIIFPSTHLIFENCKRNRAVFNEKSKPLPNLAYARSKLRCEELLSENFMNFRVLRLGSVYGAAENEKRMFNLPNLFPLRAKKNLDLKLFSRGVQIKSIVSVEDVARAMIFVKKNSFRGQIFNLVSEHLTVKKIGQLCKKFNKNIRLIMTKDKIPYEGYFIDCSKIIRNGFRFKDHYKKFAQNFITKN